MPLIPMSPGDSSPQSVDHTPLAAAPSRVAGLLSLLVPLGTFLLLVLVVRPWGNYPLTDDWIYARIARRFVQTGKFIFDHDTAASFMLQGVIAAPVIRILGFSYTHLRGLTICFSAFTLYLLWQLLCYAAVRPLVRSLVLLVVVWNPIFAATSMSFLTDIYGYSVALLGAVLWFGGRRERQQLTPPATDRSPVVSWPAAILAGFVVGASFWIRQHCVMVYPALLGAAVFNAWRAGEMRRLRSSAWRLAVSCLVFATVIMVYFPFAKYQAVVPMTDFTSRIHRIWPINPGVPLISAGIFLTYMTAFFFPVLLILPIRQLGRGMLRAGIALFALGLVTALLLLTVPPKRDLFHVFPFLDDFIYNAGVGPILFPEVMIRPLRPQWPSSVWVAIECFLLAANALWAAVILFSRQILRRREGSRASEMVWFAGLFVFGCLTVTTLVDRLATFDRYYLPEILGLTLIAAVALSHWLDTTGPPPKHRSKRLVLRFSAALLPLAFFTTAGLHDYFRWNDVRWALFHEIVNRGVSPANIQGGKEINGSQVYDFILSKSTPPACIGPCSCDFGWYCLDDSYRIGMNVYGDYEVVASRQPTYWLAPGPPISLSRRRAPRLP
jgi:hypothetical protein